MPLSWFQANCLASWAGNASFSGVQRRTMAEHERHWEPLKEALIPDEAAQFAWRQETGSIQSYQHIETGLHIHIDGADGQFFDRSSLC